MIRSVPLLLTAGALMAWAGFVPAQSPSQGRVDPLTEQNPREILPAPVLTVPELEGEPVRMSMRDVVLTTVAQNLDIQVVLLDRSIAAEQVFREFGIYDPTLFGSVTRTRVDAQSRIPDADVYQNVTTSQAGVAQRTPWGTNISVFATDQRSRDLRTQGTGTPDPINPSYESALGVQVTQPLLKNFGALVNNGRIRISRRQLDQANLSYAEEVQNRLAGVMAAYWNLDFAIRNLEVQRQALASAREFLRITNRQVEVGSLPRLSLLQAEAQVAQRETFVSDAEAGVVDAQDRLLQLMNWDSTDWQATWNRPIIPSDVPTYTDQLDLDDQALVELARVNRLDFLRDQLQVDISQINRDVTRRQRLPELNAFGGYTFSGLEDSRRDSWNTTADTQYSGYNVGLELRYPLFNREARAAHRQALDQLDKALLQLENRELQILRDVRSATRNLRTTLRQIESTTRTVEFDIEKLNQQLRRLDVGDRTVFDVLEFQTDLADSRAAQARALANYQIGLVELARSAGILLQVQGIEVPDEQSAGGWEVNYTPSNDAARVMGTENWIAMLQQLSATEAAVPQASSTEDE